VTKKLMVLVLLVVAPLYLHAGTKHIGNGDSRKEACEQAEKKAENGAKNSGLGGTCYEACEYKNCNKQESGGDTYWSCHTWSADHRGSCEKDPSKIRVY
jgi:hypothetical protein